MNRILRNLSTLVISLFILVSVGCEQFTSKTVTQICIDNPELCSDLNPDAWCRAEKAEIIKHRYQFRDKLAESHMYDLLRYFENYRTCISKAAQIKHIKLREKESGRMMGLLTAQREIDRLAELTRYSQNPQLAYYQWSRHGHTDALDVFLRAARNGELDTAELNVAHATYLVKSNSAKAINALYLALSLYSDEEDIDVEIFNSLYTLHYERENFADAFIWGLVGTHFEGSVINRDHLISMAEAQSLNIDDLVDKSRTLHAKIESREFKFSAGN